MTYIISSLWSLYYLFIGLIGISLLVGFHEFGHFIFAKMFGIGTPSFSIGFGPALIKKKIGDTVFKISAIPLGGYVEIAGMEEVMQGEQKEARTQGSRSFASKPYYQKLLVLFGGILFNLLFAYLSLILLFSMGIPKTPILFPINATTTIEKVENDSPAQAAGLQAGDVLVGFDNTAVENDIQTLLSYVAQAQGKPIAVQYRRDGQLLNTTINVPEKADSPFKGRMGVGFGFKETQALPLGQAIKQGIATTNTLIKLYITAFTSVIKKRTTSGLGGPLLIISQITKGAQQGFAVWLLLLVVISINLAILNILPLPILDGGQILFVTIEAIIGRPLPENIRMGIHYASWILILLLIVYLTFRDIRLLAWNK